MIDLFKEIEGKKHDFSFNNGYGHEILAYVVHECECCMNQSHDVILVGEANAFHRLERENSCLRIEKVATDDKCNIMYRSFEMTFHHNFWVKCSEYFAEKILLEEE